MSLPIACALRMRQMKSAGRPQSSLQHGIGYQRASRILDLPANTLRDWARAWRAGKFRTTISPHLYRYSDAVKRKAVRMRQKGHTWHEIAEATGVGASTCKRWMDKLGQSAAKGRADEIRP